MPTPENTHQGTNGQAVSHEFSTTAPEALQTFQRADALPGMLEAALAVFQALTPLEKHAFVSFILEAPERSWAKEMLSEDAVHWAQHASLNEVAAYLWACWQRLPTERRAKFLQFATRKPQ